MIATNAAEPYHSYLIHYQRQELDSELEMPHFVSMKAHFLKTLLIGLGLLLGPFISSGQCDFDVTASIQPTVADNIYCTYDTITLSTPDTFDTYQWYYNFSASSQGGTAIDGATEQSYTATAGEFGFVYFYLEATKNNCTATSSTILIDTWAFLSPVIISFPESQYCRGDSSIIAIGSGLWENIQWTKDNIPIPGATDSTFWVKESGTYVVFASPSICPETELTSGLGPSFTFEGPEIPEITQQGDTLKASSGPSYQWYLAGQPIIDATNPNYIPTASGDYSVQVSDGSGCTVFSPIYSFVLSSNESPGSEASIRLYPNPAAEQVILENLPKDLTKIELIDASGRILRRYKAAGAVQWLEDISGLKSGVYFFRIWKAGKWFSRSFVKKQ